MTITLQELAVHLGAQLKGDASVVISRVNTLDKAGPNDVAFLSDKKYRPLLKTTQAGAVIVSAADQALCSGPTLVVANPYLGFALAAQILDTTPQPATDIHLKAVVAEDVILGKGVAIGANTVIESGVELGDGVLIGPGCFVGKGAKLGAGTRLWANVSIYHPTTAARSSPPQGWSASCAPWWVRARSKPSPASRDAIA